jgi:quercetin dioxygenase-like cupin family protein
MGVLRDEQTVEEWRPGVVTRLRASAGLGAERLCAFEQWAQPGTGAPRHRHPDDEELILILSGAGRLDVDGEEEDVRAGDTVVIPPGVWHSFVNTAEETLHVLAVFSSARPTAVYADDPDTTLEIGLSPSPHRTPRAETSLR